MSAFRIGAQMFSLRDKTQTEEGLLAALKEVKAMGYHMVQLSGHNQGIAPEAIADMLKETGLICGATHFGFEMMKAEPERIIRIHELWNCKYPGIGFMPMQFHGSKEGYMAFAGEMNELGKRFGSDGLHLMYHNHAFEFAKLNGETGMELLLNNTTENVQFEVDTYWVQAGGADPVEWIRRVRGRMDVVHFKEMVGCEPKNGTMTCMAPVGEGNLNWQRIFTACDEVGVKYAFVEQDNAVETDSYACMRLSHDNLVKMGGSF